jgi:predicted RNA-binding Zn-ribbon protein involved in translation (DUF1610 family)
MPINMACPSCGKTLAAPETAAGKRAKCPACGQIMIVPESAQEAVDSGSPSASSVVPSAGSAADSSMYDFSSSSAIPPSSAQADGGELRYPCPDCGEMIIVGAAKCRFCGAIFDSKLKRTSGRISELKPIAQFQKAMMICLSIQLLAFLAAGVIGATGGPHRGMQPPVVILSLAFWIAHIAGAVLAIILASRLFSVLATVFLGLLAVIPCIGIIGLFVVNSSATTQLKLNDINVGFLGADLSQF